MLRFLLSIQNNERHILYLFLYSKNNFHLANLFAKNKTSIGGDYGDLVINIYDPSRTTIFHEVSHGRVYSLPRNFLQYWEQINNSGVPRKKAYSHKDQFLSTAGFGYARAYGASDIHEDIATMVEFISRFKQLKKRLLLKINLLLNLI